MNKTAQDRGKGKTGETGNNRKCWEEFQINRNSCLSRKSCIPGHYSWAEWSTSWSKWSRKLRGISTVCYKWSSISRCFLAKSQAKNEQILIDHSNINSMRDRLGLLVECIIEITISKKNWLLFGICNPHENLTVAFVDTLSKNLDHFSALCDSGILTTKSQIQH